MIGTRTMPKAKRNPRTGSCATRPLAADHEAVGLGLCTSKIVTKARKSSELAIADVDEWIDLATALFIVVGTDRIALEAAGEDTE
jgi:hypothetical protein